MSQTRALSENAHAAGANAGTLLIRRKGNPATSLPNVTGFLPFEPAIAVSAAGSDCSACVIVLHL